MSKTRKWLPVVLPVLIVGLFLACPDLAHAAAAGGNIKELTTPFQKLVDTMCGPIALGLVAVGFIGGMWGFMTGGELNGFVRSMVVCVLGGAVLTQSKPILNSLFTGAIF